MEDQLASQRSLNNLEDSLEPAAPSKSRLKPLLQNAEPEKAEAEKIELLPHGWPTSSKTIKASVTSIMTDVALDIILLALAVAFFAFGLTVRFYDQTPTATHPRLANALVEATKYGPSIFPILFASILGRAAHSILGWRLEIGERIGVLDMLAGSTSLTSTITSQLQLRMISFLGLALVVIWAMSPIGGQASFRQMMIGSSISTTPASFIYMINGGLLDSFDNSDRITSFGIVNALFLTLMAAPMAVRKSSVDTWGNVKIPWIENYENSSIPDSEGWFTHDTSLDTIDSYSSLAGIPISGVKHTSLNYTMNMETTYLRLECPLVNYQNYSYPNGTEIDGNNGASQIIEKNGTQVFRGTGAAIWSNDDTLQRGQDYTNSANFTTLQPRTFFYVSLGPTGLSQCSITTTYIEADIVCNTTCAVARLRRSQLPTNLSPAFILIDDSPNGWDQFSSAFVTSVIGHADMVTPVQIYLYEPENPFSAATWISSKLKTPPIKSDVYVARLGLQLNTYWDLINGMYAIPGGIGPTTALVPGSNNTAGGGFLANVTTANGTQTSSTQVIEAQNGWIAVLSIASIVMIIASLVSPILRYAFKHSPEVMLNISSLATRNSPYFPFPLSGTYMAAAHRASLLKNFKIKFGDVEAGSDVGRLAITLVDEGEEEKLVERVKKGRLYK